jgi:hypothetical protein
VRAPAQVNAAVDAIDQGAWVDINYTHDGVAQAAETTPDERRLIVRRTSLVGAPVQLGPTGATTPSSPTQRRRRHARRRPPRLRRGRTRHP